MSRSHLLFELSAFTLFVLQSVAHAAATPTPGSEIFARQNPGCIQNCAVPDCACAANQICQLSAQSCTACPVATCIDNSSATPESSGPSVGAIAGGTVGGVFVAGIIAFLVYRSCVKKRQVMSMAASAAEKERNFGMLKSARASTHTVASIASTVRTRASNVIQIAFIPGVTSRSPPSTPGHLVPPVPPITYMDSGSPTVSQFPRSPLAGDFHFSADDIIRGSMYTVNDNRSSVATTIYGQNAVVAQPVSANVVRAGKAAVVNVHSKPGGSSLNTTSPSSEDVPPLPTTSNFPNPIARARSPLSESTVPPSPAFSVGSTFLHRMNSTRTKTDATTISSPVPSQRRILTGGRRSPQAIHENYRTTSSFTYNSSDDEADDDQDNEEEDIQPGQRSKRMQSQCNSYITDMEAVSPFSDTNSVDVNMFRPEGKKRESLMVVVGSSAGTAKKDGGEPGRTVSPFDDSHSIDRRE